MHEDTNNAFLLASPPKHNICDGAPSSPLSEVLGSTTRAAEERAKLARLAACVVARDPRVGALSLVAGDLGRDWTVLASGDASAGAAGGGGSDGAAGSSDAVGRGVGAERQRREVRRQVVLVRDREEWETCEYGYVSCLRGVRRGRRARRVPCRRSGAS